MIFGSAYSSTGLYSTPASSASSCDIGVSITFFITPTWYSPGKVPASALAATSPVTVAVSL